MNKAAAVIPITALSLWKQQPQKGNGIDQEEEWKYNVVLHSNPYPPVIHMVLPPPTSHDSSHCQNHLPTMIPKWLQLYGRNGIIEISGEAGTGKTQLCLSICLNLIFQSHLQTPRLRPFKRPHSSISTTHDQDIIAPSCFLRHHAMFISLGESTSISQIAHRLYQMTRERLTMTPGLNLQEDEEIHDMIQRIYIRNIYNTEDFSNFLKEELPNMLQQTLLNKNHDASSQNIGLIVFDSVAALYRTPEEEEYNDKKTTNHKSTFHHSSFYTKRSEMLFDISSQLKKLSDMYGVHMIVVNQVTGTGSGKNVPSLGLSWSHCVNERYQLFRKEIENLGNTPDHDDKEESVTKGITTRFERSLHLMASSKRKVGSSCKISISSAGVHCLYIDGG